MNVSHLNEEELNLLEIFINKYYHVEKKDIKHFQ